MGRMSIERPHEIVAHSVTIMSLQCLDIIVPKYCESSFVRKNVKTKDNKHIFDPVYKVLMHSSTS